MAKTMKMTCDDCGIEATDEYIRGFKKITVCLCESCFRKYEERNGIL